MKLLALFLTALTTGSCVFAMEKQLGPAERAAQAVGERVRRAQERVAQQAAARAAGVPAQQVGRVPQLPAPVRAGTAPQLVMPRPGIAPQEEEYESSEEEISKADATRLIEKARTEAGIPAKMNPKRQGRVMDFATKVLDLINDNTKEINEVEVKKALEFETDRWVALVELFQAGSPSSWEEDKVARTIMDQSSDKDRSEQARNIVHSMFENALRRELTTQT